MSVPILPGSASPTGTPQLAIDAHYFQAPLGRSYDVSRDGKRFLMIEDAGGPDAANAVGVVVVLNWAEELNARLPAAKR